MKDYKNLMPIGTIVKLKEDADFRRYMIIALIVKNEQGEQKDYVGVRYPAGLFSLDSCFFFDREDIEEVVFLSLIHILNKRFKFNRRNRKLICNW